MYKLHLILKYLRKRRIAWVSLIAVTLCTALVLVVISVMGGWLRMFRQSFHGLSGDVLVSSRGFNGFAGYEKMVERIEALPDVGKGNAVPVIHTFGLININNQIADKVQVLGYPIEKIGNVNDFNVSLFRQGPASREQAVERLQKVEARVRESGKPADAGATEYMDYLRLKAGEAQRPASFDLLTEAFVSLDHLPAGVVFPPTPARFGTDGAATTDPTPRVRYDAPEKLLLIRGRMGESEHQLLASLSPDPAYQRAIHDLFIKSQFDVIDYRQLIPKPKGKVKVEVDVSTWPGMIPGVGVLGIHKDKAGDIVGRSPDQYIVKAKLTVLGITAGSVGVELSDKSERNYWIVDDSRTRVYQYDSSTVYVPFDVLQRDLRMDGQAASPDSPAIEPHASQLFIRIKPEANLDATRDAIEKVVRSVEQENPVYLGQELFVLTWEQSQKTYLNAIENEKVLVTFLFGLISIVAVFLIFCIFYMIVVEKTRDIGIVKSVGATSAGVAGIFLGYGLVIGVVGAGMGLLFGYLIIHNINYLHMELGRLLGIVIWNPEVYAFDTIPNTMNPKEVAVILTVAVLSAVLGALVPAIRAAGLHPVESLRWE